MKLLRYGPAGAEKPGLLDAAGGIRDLSEHVRDIDGATLAPATLARLATLDPLALPRVAEPVRLGSCMARPGKYLCIGLNYADHAAETGAAIPEEPILFMKATSAVVGPNDDIVRPRESTKLDWEVELAIVIGSRCSYADAITAERAIAGWCVAHDVSERAFQLERGGTWDKGKGCDTFGPLGPWLVTRDALPDVSDLSMFLDVNGERMQSGSTATMIFKPIEIVAYLSRFMTLEPGDVIATGTPPGVGLGMTPPRWLQPGDEVRLGIAGLGEQRQRVVQG